MGVVSPAGCSLASFWDRLLTGTSTAGPIRSFDATALQVRFACEVADFDPGSSLSEKQRRRHDRFAQFTLVAAATALADSGLRSVAPERAGVVAGTGFGGMGSLEAELARFQPGKAVHPLIIPAIMPNAATGLVALELGWRGPNLSVSTACAAGTHALGEGARLITSGAADVVLAGAAESPITPFVVSAFAALRALSTRNEDPPAASRPFDSNRDGFVLGEGAAFVVLESDRHLAARGARSYAEVAGYATTNDAHDLVMPAPDGAAAAACMRAAIADAGLRPADIAHVNAHGTATRSNDRAEAAALVSVFGPSPPPVTATKGWWATSSGRRGRSKRWPPCSRSPMAWCPPPPTSSSSTGLGSRRGGGRAPGDPGRPGAVELVRLRWPQRQPGPVPPGDRGRAQVA